MPELVVDHPGETRRSFHFDKDVVIIGRDAASDVVLDSAFVSRVHLRLERHVEGYEVHDPGSRNGAFLNGRRLTVGRRQRLKSGDELGVADFLITYVETPQLDSTLDWAARLPDVLYVDAPSRSLWLGAKRMDVHLTSQEFDLLELLYGRKGQVVSHDEIGERIWGSELIGGRSVPRYDLNMIHQLVSRLRRKLQPDPNLPAFIVSVARVGYRLDDRPTERA
jgi:hypothetical protein